VGDFSIDLSYKQSAAVPCSNAFDPAANEEDKEDFDSSSSASNKSETLPRNEFKIKKEPEQPSRSLKRSSSSLHEARTNLPISNVKPSYLNAAAEWRKQKMQFQGKSDSH
jgi:hypothetical protein